MDALIEQLNRLRGMLQAPMMTMGEIASIEVPEGQLFRQLSVRVGTNFIRARVVRDRDGSVTVNTDLTIPTHVLIADYRRIRQELGLLLCEERGIMDWNQ